MKYLLVLLFVAGCALPRVEERQRKNPRSQQLIGCTKEFLYENISFEKSLKGCDEVIYKVQ
jgi:hypothetical protein